MRKTNLFPNYPAAAIADAPAATRERTYVTPEIRTVRGLVEQWAARFRDPDIPARPEMVAVIGDYGTGKTHLLLYAAACAQTFTGDQALSLRLIAPEDTPAAWFRIESSPLKRQDSAGVSAAPPLPLRDLVSLVMRQAALTAADANRLTKPLAERLRANPDYLPEALEKLNLSVVEEEFRKQIDSICGPAVSPDVKTAIAGLSSGTTAEVADRWLSGASLTVDEMSTLRVQSTQAGDTELLGLLVSVAALLNFAGRPFVLMIDELEHFANFDRAHTERKNLTWLKRLLEALAAPAALVVVAGHTTDAWELEPNLLTRFADHIRMIVLSPEDIIRYVEFVTRQKLDGWEEQAKAIHEATGGKMREVATLCSALWDETEGFEKKISPAAIQAKNSVLPSRAVNVVQGLLQELGYRVLRDSVLLDSRFDLLAYRQGVLEAVFDFSHIVTQESPKSEIKPFEAKVKGVSSLYPNVLVCRIAEGNTDPELSALARSIGPRARYFDTKAPDFLEQLRAALSPTSPPQPSAPTPVAALVEKTQIVDRQLMEARNNDDQVLLQELRQQRVALDREMAGSLVLSTRRFSAVRGSLANLTLGACGGCGTLSGSSATRRKAFTRPGRTRPD